LEWYALVSFLQLLPQTERLASSGCALLHALVARTPRHGGILLVRLVMLAVTVNLALVASGQAIGSGQDSIDANQADKLSDQQPNSTSLDRVLVRQGTTATSSLSVWKPLRQSVLVGRVNHLDSKELVLETDVDSEQPRTMRVPGGQLMGIVPVWSGTGTSALVQLFENQRYAEFVQALREHDRSQIPRWQQLLLLEMVVRAVDAVQGPAASGQHFLTLAESAPDMFYADMPLCWTVSEPSVELVKKSRQWLDSTNEVAQLLGSSWLLQTSDSTEAQEVLLKLKASRNTAVAQLASAQAWRLTSPPETMDKLESWTDRVSGRSVGTNR